MWVLLPNQLRPTQASPNLSQIQTSPDLLGSVGAFADVCHQLLLAPENGKAINETKKAEWHPYKCAPASNSEPCVSALACQKNTLDAGIAPSVIPTQSLADLPPDHPNPTDDHPDPAGDYPDPADDIQHPISTVPRVLPPLTPMVAAIVAVAPVGMLQNSCAMYRLNLQEWGWQWCRWRGGSWIKWWTWDIHPSIQHLVTMRPHSWGVAWCVPVCSPGWPHWQHVC